jgi:hypothetical protein
MLSLEKLAFQVHEERRREAVGVAALGNATDGGHDKMNYGPLAIDAIDAYAGTLGKEQLREHGGTCPPEARSGLRC